MMGLPSCPRPSAEQLARLSRSERKTIALAPIGVKAAVRAQRPRRLLLGVGNHARRPTRRRVAALHKKRDENGGNTRPGDGQHKPSPVRAFDLAPLLLARTSILVAFRRFRRSQVSHARDEWVSLAAAAVPTDVLPPSLFQAAHTATVQGRARVQATYSWRCDSWSARSPEASVAFWLSVSRTPTQSHSRPFA